MCNKFLRISLSLLLILLSCSANGYSQSTGGSLSVGKLYQSYDLNQQGLVLLRENKVQESIEKFQAAIKLEPNYEFYFNLGIAYHKLGNLKAAQEALKQALTLNPRYDEGWRELVKVLTEDSQYIEAKTAFENSLRNKPKTRPVPALGLASADLESLGFKNISVERSKINSPFNAPEPSFTPPSENVERLSTAPSTPIPVHEQAPAPAPIEAKAEPQSIVKSEPAPAPIPEIKPEPEPIAETIINNTESKKTEIAEIEEPVATSTPAHEFPGAGNRHYWVRACALYDEASLLAHEGNLDRAILKYRSAIIIYPYDPDFYHNLGLLLKKKGSYKQAIEAYKQALQLSPEDWDTWYNLGSVYFESKRYAESHEAFMKAAKYNPSSQGKENINSYLAQLKAKNFQ